MAAGMPLLPSALPPKGEASRYGANNFLNLIALPEGAEVGSRYRLKKNVRYAFPRFVIPSAAEGSFSFPVSVFFRNAVCMKHRPSDSLGARCFPLAAILTSFV